MTEKLLNMQAVAEKLQSTLEQVDQYIDRFDLPIEYHAGECYISLSDLLAWRKQTLFKTPGIFKRGATASAKGKQKQMKKMDSRFRLANNFVF